MRTTPGRWRLLAATVVGSLLLSAGPMFAAAGAGTGDRSATASAAVLAGPNLAAGKSASSSSSTQNYAASNVTDGNQGTYWESANNAFPQWVQVDLGSSVSTNQVVLKLPTSGWGARDQTLAVQGSTDGQNFNDLSASASRAFSPPSNAVTIDYGASTVRYLRIRITANTGWPAGQLSELEVYGPATGDTQAPTAPGSLAFTEPAAGQIRLTWNASTDNVGVTGYDVYANGELRTSLGGTVLAYTDNQPASVSVSYFIRAKDAVGNQSANSNIVTRGGSNGPGSNLALGKPITASGHVHTFVATNANDDNVQTYWEGNGNPATLTTQLGANANLSSIVIRLNPDNAWGNRTQTFSILGREQSATGFTTIVASAAYNFSPSSGNSVTIPVSARVADVRLNFTANTGAPAGQVAEFQVLGDPAPNPDLTVSNVTWTPTSPVETDTITLSARVNNTGTAGSAATDVNFYLGATKVGTAAVGALAVGASTTVTAAIGSRDAGSYPLSAKVDESNAIIEQNDANNTRNERRPAGRHTGREFRPDRVRGELDSGQSSGRQHRDVLGRDQEPGQHRVSGRRARHHVDAAERQYRSTDSHGLVLRCDCRRSHHSAGQSRHVAGGQRPVLRPRGARRRRERVAGQAHQQHQREATLRGSRREHAVRPSGSRRCHGRWWRVGRRTEPHHRRPRR